MTRCLKIAVFALILVLGLGATVLAAPDSFTIMGRVVDPEGRPVAGAPLQIVPHIPSGGWDTLNNFYKIPNYNWHQTTTNRDGEFIMENVINYPENYSHNYAIVARAGYNGFHIVQLVNLPTIVPKTVEGQPIRIQIRAQYATKVVVALKDQNGKPFNGKKVLFFQSGRGVGNPINGTAYITEAEFVDGVYQRYVVVKPGGYGRVAILAFDSEKQAELTLLSKGLKINESLDGLSYTLKDASGGAVSAETAFVPGGESRVELRLP